MQKVQRERRLDETVSVTMTLRQKEKLEREMQQAGHRYLAAYIRQRLGLQEQK